MSGFGRPGAAIIDDGTFINDPVTVSGFLSWLTGGNQIAISADTDDSGAVLSFSSFAAGGGKTSQLTMTATNAAALLSLAADQLGFFGTAPIVKPAVAGSRGGNAALGNLLTALANLGLLTNNTTA